MTDSDGKALSKNPDQIAVPSPDGMKTVNLDRKHKRAMEAVGRLQFHWVRIHALGPFHDDLQAIVDALEPVPESEALEALSTLEFFLRKDGYEDGAYAFDLTAKIRKAMGG